MNENQSCSVAQALVEERRHCFLKFVRSVEGWNCRGDTVDGRNFAPVETCKKPCRSWDIFHIKWLTGFLPSTVGHLNFRQKDDVILLGGQVAFVTL